MKIIKPWIYEAPLTAWRHKEARRPAIELFFLKVFASVASVFAYAPAAPFFILYLIAGLLIYALEKTLLASEWAGRKIFLVSSMPMEYFDNKAVERFSTLWAFYKKLRQTKEESQG